MSRTTPGAGRAPRSWLWRGVAIIAVVVLVVSLPAGVLWFFADPLNVSGEWLEVLDQRASVVGMFSGMVLGVAGLVVAVVALRAQVRAGHAHQVPSATEDAPDAAPETSSAVSGSSGIVPSGDGVRNVQMRAEASGQGRVYQAAGDQTINER